MLYLSQQKAIIMKQTLEENDALLRLSDLTRTSTADIKAKIINFLEDHGLLGGEAEECGKTVKEIMLSQKMAVFMCARMVFPGMYVVEEIAEFTGALKIWGDGEFNVCGQCGCEVDIEHDGQDGKEWTNEKCSNKACDYAINNEPDWDTMPGGKDYY